MAQQFDASLPLLTMHLTRNFVDLAPQAKEEIQAVMGEVLKRFPARKAELIEEIAKLHAEKLTLKELRELVRFYSRGIGAKFMAMQPELTQRSMLLSERWGEMIGREIDAEVRRELKKRGIDI